MFDADLKLSLSEDNMEAIALYIAGFKVFNFITPNQICI
jgi:hypothetical protein